MQNFRASSKFPPCYLPKCNCQKCEANKSADKQNLNETESCENLRLEDELDQIETHQSLHKSSSFNASTSATNKSKKFEIGNLFTLPNFTMPTFNVTPTSLQSLLFDIVGVISFFIIATAMFWITVTQYLWQFIGVILHSTRIIRFVALALLLLLGLSITFHAIKARQRYLQNMQSFEKPSDSLQLQDKKPPPKCSHSNSKSCQHKKSQCYLKNSKKSNCNLDSDKTPSLCDLIAKQVKDEKLSDGEASEMYKRYKLYSVPSEMKAPPSITNIIEILSGFVGGIINSIITT